MQQQTKQLDAKSAKGEQRTQRKRMAVWTQQDDLEAHSEGFCALSFSFASFAFRLSV
jgi:hypothetical protein